MSLWGKQVESEIKKISDELANHRLYVKRTGDEEVKISAESYKSLLEFKLKMLRLIMDRVIKND